MLISDLTRGMVDRFPEIAQAYEEETQWLDDDLPHVIFGMVFNPLVEKNLRCWDALTLPLLKRLFEFMEQMATSGDEAVENVLHVTVLESMVSERDIVPRAKTLMGPVTRQLFTEIETAYGWTEQNQV